MMAAWGVFESGARGPADLAKTLRLGADRIASLILYSDMEWVDIQIEINSLRDVCEEYAPEKLELFDLVYESRFARLWEQWREVEGGGEENR